jgi:ACGX-repeat protein
MALSNLAQWNNLAMAAGATSCGASDKGDKGEEKPSACGSACGASGK